MKVMGIEVRKANNLKSVFDDVDKVLSLKPIEDVQQQAVAHALHNMLKADTYFSICTIDKCVKVSQVVIPQERYDIYSSCHCVHWRDMTEDFRQTLIAMVLDDFRSVLTR